MSEWRVIEPTRPMFEATKPVEFVASTSFTRDVEVGQFVEMKPYPGWRFVFLRDGRVRHEKIPTIWQRVRRALGLAPPTSEKE